jgi:CRISPR-associated protein Csb3
MTEITLSSCDPHTLLSHLALYGLGAILESNGVRDLRIGWTKGGNPRPQLSAPEIDDASLAVFLSDHARTLTAADSWPMRSLVVLDKNGKGTARGLMSPLLSRIQGDEAWAHLQRSRWEVLDALTTGRRLLDLMFLAALGEPAYWSYNRQGEPQQDDGASRLEMQQRNQGAEFIGTKVRKLAEVVARRKPDAILSGLRGETTEDEWGKNGADSRTSTGLSSPGPTDNALAWCAIWGISQFPLTMRVNTTADTSGHLSKQRNEWFYTPMWLGQWRPARLRTVVASESLRLAAAARTTPEEPIDPRVSTARAWLRDRGVAGVMRFPVGEFGTGNARERRALRGVPVAVGEAS